MPMKPLYCCWPHTHRKDCVAEKRFTIPSNNHIGKRDEWGELYSKPTICLCQQRQRKANPPVFERYVHSGDADLRIFAEMALANIQNE